jgi:hypothetical protein
MSGERASPTVGFAPSSLCPYSPNVGEGGNSANIRFTKFYEVRIHGDSAKFVCRNVHLAYTSLLTSLLGCPGLIQGAEGGTRLLPKKVVVLMRRIGVVLGVAAVMAAVVALTAGTALAQEESLPDLTIDKTGPSTVCGHYFRKGNPCTPNVKKT